MPKIGEFNRHCAAHNARETFVTHCSFYVSSRREMQHQQSNGKRPAPRPGVHLPVNMNFNDVGPIAPPRMFSDPPAQQSVLQMINNIESGMQATEEEMCDRCDSPIPTFNVNTKSTIPVCIIKNDCDGDENPILEEEVPAKEPQLTAVPLKSALKKPRVGVSSAMNYSSKSSYSPSPTPSSNSSFSSYSTNHQKPPAPAPPIHQAPYSQASSIKPQVSPRFAYTYGAAPVQLLPTGNSPLVNAHRHQAA